MTALRIALYLICFISISWSMLVFGGPIIIKRLILGYTNGALVPSDITVSPTLGVSISRLDFTISAEALGSPVEGFARAVEISWSLYGENPFLNLYSGPSILKNFASADSVSIVVPLHREIDWENILLHAKFKNLSLNSFGEVKALNLKANVNLETSKVSNVNLEAQSISADVGGSNYASNAITGELSDLNLSAPLKDQFFLGTFSVQDITVSEPNLNTSEAILKIYVTEDAKNFEIDLRDLRLSEFDGYIKDIKVDGDFDQGYVLRDLNIDFLSGTFSSKLPGFSNILTTVVKMGNEKYDIFFHGNFNEFELSDSDNFLGLLPPSNFEIDLKLDGANSKVISQSKIKFNNLEIDDIYGYAEMTFRVGGLKGIKCAIVGCELPSFDLAYKVDFNSEWVSGRADCSKASCDRTDISYFLRTSNTVNIFTILNQTGIFSPLLSLYIFNLISSGEKINNGHVLKF